MMMMMMLSLIQVLYLNCHVIPCLPSCQVFSTKTKICNNLFTYSTTLVVTVTINEHLHRFNFVYLKERKEGKKKHEISLVRDVFMRGRGLIILFVEHSDRDVGTGTQMTQYCSTLCEPIKLKPLP